MKPTTQQLKTKFAFIVHNFTVDELNNPVTAQSVAEALSNIKVAIAATERQVHVKV